MVSKASKSQDQCLKEYNSVDHYLNEEDVEGGRIVLDSETSEDEIDQISEDNVALIYPEFLESYEDPADLTRCLENEKCDFTVRVDQYGSPLSAPLTDYNLESFWVSDWGKVLYISQT